MKLFLFSMLKKLAWHWAAKLLKPEAVSELVILMVRALANRTDSKVDDGLLIWLEKNLDGQA